MKNIVDKIAETILYSERGDSEPGVDWPGDIDDARAITTAVLRALMDEPDQDLGTLFPWPEGERITCVCGRSFSFYFNGGELDQRDCECGRNYRGHHGGVLVEVTGP